MGKKIDAIDYLRGLSILAIIIIHILALHDTSVITEYTKNSVLFNLRDVLQFCVVTIVICSGFSLYLNYNKVNLNFKELFDFYKKRFKRMLIPWWTFLTIFFLIHFIIKLIFKIELIEISKNYIISSYFTTGGIGFGWLILLILITSLLFPLLKWIYDNADKRILFFALTSMFLFSFKLFMRNSFDNKTFTFGSTSMTSLILFSTTFLLGWIIIYLIGFVLAEVYNKKPSLMGGPKIAFGSIVLFVIMYIIYNILNLNKQLYINKYPPSPYYISFGLMITFTLLTMFFGYKHLIHSHFKKLLSFFSSNSYWLFMWSALVLSLITPFLSLFQFNNIYLKFIIAIILNITGTSILVILQNKLRKIRKTQYF